MNSCSLRSLLKRFLPLSLTCILSFFQSGAQVKLGIFGGIHSANVLESNNLPSWDSAVKRFQSSRSGFQAGVLVEIPIGHKGFYFQPAISYTAKGRQYAKSNDSAGISATDTVYTKQSLNLGYIDIPLQLVYKIPLSANRRNSFFISAGPQVSFFYNGNLNSQTQTSGKYTANSTPLSVGSGPDTYTTFDVGASARAGFELGNVLLNGYFSRGLTNFYHAPYQGSFHHQIIGVSLGIWLTSTTPPPPPPPKDTDKDGIPDDQDLCPLQPGTLAWHGCPVPDTDHDGIDDEHDSCKTVSGVARYHGCPIPDRDGDGVNDEEDKCPDQPGLARYQGCPIPDRDGDGVNDEEDKCPDTPGTKENFGCPVIKKEEQEKINYSAKNIQFAKASDQLKDTVSSALDEIAALLLAHPEWHLTVEGYTDNEGTPERNLVLSQKRAMTVRNYLIRRGVLPVRLTATGYGQEHPLADNSTLAGKAANRRVELKLSIEKP